MKVARIAVFVVATLLMGIGYFMSQAAYFASLDPESRGATARYAEAIDVPAVKAVSLVLLLACVVFVAMPQEKEQAE